MKSMHNVKAQAGFTLIELVAVIVILGILSATALPRFIDLSDAAEESAVSGVAGGLSSGAALNHANNLAADSGLTTTTALVTVTNCTDVAGLLDGGLPARNVIVSLAVGASEGDTVNNCTVFIDTDGDGALDAGEANANFSAYNVQ